MVSSQTRRKFLSNAFVTGCSLAASPLLTPVTWASTSGEGRLVVIILRGGMDGLGAIAPYGDPVFSDLRPQTSVENGYVDLDGYFAMNGALSRLHGLWRTGELSFAHAVSTPYRNKRSHFDGQDLLEAGIASLDGGTRDGWLNRLLTHLPNASAESAYSIGRDRQLILSGDAKASLWSPEVDLTLSPQALKLAKMLMAEDVDFAASFNAAALNASQDGDAVEFDGSPQDMMMQMQANMGPVEGGIMERQIAEFAGAKLAQDTRIATFSINGWDTHDNQEFGLRRALRKLSESILALKDASGPEAWENTAVIAMTEFGRTARINGTKGTDHGTGGAVIMAGGALKGHKVHTRWPGLAEADLFAKRDLMPTRDVRAFPAWLIHGLFGTDKKVLQTEIFPDLDMGSDPGLLS